MDEKIKKKRVFFVITQSEMGGAQHFLINLLPRLNPANYDLLVGVGGNGDGEFMNSLNEKGISLCILKSLKRNYRLFDNLKSIFEIRNAIKKFKPDTVFLCSSMAGFVGSLAVRLMMEKPKVIYRIGGWQFNDPRPIWQNNFYRLLEKMSTWWKDIIIVNNYHDLEQAKKYNIGPVNKILLIHNGLNAYKMGFFDREEARLKLLERASKYSGKVFQSKFIVGTIANFYPSKGLEYIIETAFKFKDNQDIVFLIIGDGKERGKIEKLIQENNLEKKVFLLGRIPEANKLMPGFDIFVLPSVKEGFPWVILEAMSAKLPVIATSVGAMPEIIKDGKNGFIVQPRDPQSISDRIKEIISDERLAQELGIQAHQTVLFDFTLDKMVKQIEELL